MGGKKTKTIRPISRPRCACGGTTHLERVNLHPVYGKGFEVRVFACDRCDREVTTETTPGNIDCPQEPANPVAVVALLDKLLRFGRRLLSVRY